MTRVGFIGLGIMGSRMAANLRRAGFELTVWNRTAETAQSWAAEHGGTVAESPAALAAASEIVITMVVDGSQVADLLLDRDDAVAAGAQPGLLCVDMSTIAPADTRMIGEALAERGIAMVDAPVTGSSPKAQDGTLTIMAGGPEAEVRRAWPLFEAMGELIVHVGELGHGEAVKVINNAVAAANTTALGEALLAGKAAGIDLDALVQVMGAGSGGSAMLALKAGPMRAHDYSTLFKLDHMLKDVRLCLDQARAAGVEFPAAARAEELLARAAGAGHGDEDFAALLEALQDELGIAL